MTIWILIAVVSNLLGSIPFGYLLVRIFRGEDVRKSGSGNIGATNVSRKSPLLGAMTLLLDALKGSSAVGVAWLFSTRMSTFSKEAMAMAAFFAVLGHMFPVWLKFRGGKGVATGLGSFVVIAPKAVLVAVGIFVLVVAVFRYVSLGSIVSVASFPILVYLTHAHAGSPIVLGFIAVTSLLIIAKHHDNIRRLLAGSESRVGAQRA